MKFSAVFLTTLAGSALANPVAVPNADNNAKRAELNPRVLPIGTTPVPSLDIITGLLGSSPDELPIRLPAGPVSVQEINDLIGGLILGQLLRSIFTFVIPAFQVVNGVPGAANVLPNLKVPTAPADLNLGSIAAPTVVDKLSDDQFKAIFAVANAQLTNATAIHDAIPKKLFGILDMTSGQAQAYAPQIEAARNALRDLIIKIQALNAAGTLPIPSTSASGLSQVLANLGGLSAAVSAVRNLLAMLGLGNLLPIRN